MGTLEPFARDKLLISIYRSLSHKKTAQTDAESLTATLVDSLLSKQQKGLLTSEQIIKTIYDTLVRFDKAAATHYQAHHSTDNR